MDINAVIKPFAPTWTLPDTQRDALLRELLKVRISPYNQPEEFLAEVQAAGPATREFCATVAGLRQDADLEESPVVYLKNLPVESVLPVFGHDDPAGDKYAMKTTFVTEALLALFASAAQTPIIAYRTINNGDLFHDIYLKESLKNTASQKSMVSFGFHYDMGFKRVRPDWANLACLRSSAANRVSTSVCRNIDILNGLCADDIEVLGRHVFTTPPEVVSVMGGEEDKTPPLRPVHFPGKPWKFEYFEGRTITDDPEGIAVTRRLNQVLHRAKRHLVLEPGDLAAISNNHSTHCREVLEINDMAAHRIRWLIKTYNVEDLSVHRANLVDRLARTADE